MLFSKDDLKKLIIPLLLEQTLLITVGMADSMMVSSVGEAAISGVSLVDMLNYLIISILTALTTGGSVVTSQFLGAKRVRDACHSTKQLLYIVTLFAMVVAVTIIVLNKPILRLLFGSIEDDVMQCAVTYLLISACSFPFLAAYSLVAAIFRSMGNSKITFKVSLLMNGINVGGNALCIFGLKMGVEGVAIPTLVSRAAAAIVLYILIRNPSNIIHLEKGRFHFEWPLIKKILFIGIPSGVENGLFQLGRVLVVSIIAGFGTTQIAANGVANSIDSMGCIVGQAMGLAMITVIGRCVGAGDEKQIRYYTKKLMLQAYIYTAVINGIILLLLNPLLSIYSLSSETASLAFFLIMLHNSVAILFWPASFVLPNMLRACNDVRFTMGISIFSMALFRIGFSYLLGVYFNMGVTGVWYAMIIDWIFRVTSFIIRYLRNGWKRHCSVA